MLQQGIIQHIQTYEKSYYSTDNVLIMSVEFGMANQYIRDLSENTKRGLRAKARQGIYPSVAPLGYLNDVRNKTIVIDRKRGPTIRRAFEMYAANKCNQEEIANFLFKNGIQSRLIRRPDATGGKP